MEHPKEPAIGYPIDIISHAQSEYQLTAAQPTITTTTTNVVQPPRRVSCTDFLTLVVTSIILSIIFYMMVFGIFKSPSVSFQVNSVSVSSFNDSASQMTANWNISFCVGNPNKETVISYDLKDRFLLAAAVLPFYQDPMDQTEVEVSLAASSVHVEKWTDDAISFDRTRVGEVGFNVKVQAMVRLDPGTEIETKHSVLACCRNLTVAFWTNTALGMMLGGSRTCETHLETY
ncbi:hypothetical protein L1049_014304 [Liquidambar formosana]|uniref:Late embryogenesis abundant protein LEA-2 subgroup domain-containing protein n=1 Tax=Liquidambar formosana TaxID=63359 RepID=A0AAP0RQQ5_LIQFO